MPKVTYKHLEDVTKFLDKISKNNNSYHTYSEKKVANKAARLSKIIKKEYTEIKAHYE